MAKTCFYALALILVSTVCRPAFGVNAVLSADSWAAGGVVRKGGKAANLTVNSDSTAFAQFDLSVVPPGTTAAHIAQARLKVWVSTARSSGKLAVSAVQSPWDESTSVQPSFGAVGSTTDIVKPVVGTLKSTYVTVDVTATVQAWVSGDAANYGFGFSAVDGLSVAIDSKENLLTSHPPELEITLLKPSVIVRAQKTANQNLPADQTTIVSGWDDASELDAREAFATETGIFTAPVSGIYQVSATTYLGATTWGVGSSAALRVLAIDAQGNAANAAALGGHVFTSAATTEQYLSGSTVLRLNAGDRIAPAVFTSRSSSVKGNGSANHISIVRLDE